MYLLIYANDDGTAIDFVSDEKAQDIPTLMEDYSITKWTENEYGTSIDPNYWNEREGMLLRVSLSNPKPVRVVDGWELP